MEFPAITSELKEKWLDLVIRIMPVQAERRDRFKNFATLALYAMNYIVILYIISHKSFSKIQSSNLLIIGVNITRAVLNLVYIVSKQKIFLVLQKISILLHCVLTCNGFTQFFMPLLFLDLASCIVWSLSLEQKSIHFDSRLFIGSSLVKQLAITLFYFAWISFRFGKGFEELFYILFGLFLLFLDSKTNYYIKKFKKILLGLDLCCLISGGLPVLGLLTGNTVNYYQAIVIINLICVAAYVKLSDHQFSILYEIDPWANSVQSQQILDYVIDLEELTRFKQESEVIKYVVHHIRRCPVPGCFLKYHERDNHHPSMKAQDVLKIFNAQQLPILCKKYPILNEYLIFNSDAKNKQVRNSADERNFFHRRQSHRFLNKIQLQSVTKENNNESKSKPGLGIQLNLVPQIKSFTELGLQFWTQLLQYKIDSSKLLEIGAKKVKLMKKINKTYNENCSLDLKSEQMIHYYLIYLLGGNNFANMKRNRALQIQDNLSGLAEAPPTLLVSAEKQNFLRITNANISAVAATGFTKEQMTSITVDLLWDKEIREDHIVLAERRARYSTASEGQLIRSYAFLKNKFGYIVITDGVVYYFDDITGKKWCVVLYPFLENQPVIITNTRRQLIGISGSCVSFGLRTDMEGLKLNDALFSNCVKSGKPVDLTYGSSIFSDKHLSLSDRDGSGLYLKFETKIDFMNKPCYYVFTLGVKKGKAGLRESVSQAEFKFLASKNSLSVKNSQTQFDTNPAFQFTFDFANGAFRKKQGEVSSRLFMGDSMDEIDEKSGSYQIKEIKQEIIEMRLWENKIDFLENLSSPIPAFGPLPNLMNEHQVLQEEKVKSQWKLRSQHAPAQIKWLRSLTVILVLMTTGLIVFINLTAITNKEERQQEIVSHQTLILQHGQLIQLTTILIESFYNPNADMKMQLNNTIKKIDDTYKKIETMPTISAYLINDDNQYSLIKSDDIYRLAIKNYLQGAGPLDDVILQFINFVSKGWHKITMIDFAIIENHNDQGLRGYLIFMMVSSLFLVVSFIVYLSFRKKVQQRAEQICKIFYILDHRAITSQVTKFKSFKEYIDLDRSLIKQESIRDLTHEDDETNMYTKSSGNQQKFTLQTIAIFIALLVMGLYFGTVTREQYNVEETMFHHIKYLHSSNLMTLQARKLWVGLHLNQINIDLDEALETKILDFKRDLQTLNNYKLDNSYFSQAYKEFWLTLSYRDIGIIVPTELKQEIEPLVKNGQKQLIYSIIRLFNKCIDKFTTLSELKNSNEAFSMHKINKYYLSYINSLISTKIQAEFDRLQQDSKIQLATSIVIYLLSLVLVAIWYRLLACKIRQISSLEDLLYTLPFKEIQANHKLIQYLNDVKINQR